MLTVFEMSDAELEVWRGALTMLDMADQASEVVARDGGTIVDRFGYPKQNPAVDVATRGYTLFNRAVAQLGLKIPEQSARMGKAKPGPKPKPPARLRTVG